MQEIINQQSATQSHWPPPSFLPTSLYGLPQASGADPCVRLPPQTATTPPSFPSTSSYVLPQAPGANPCVRLPPQTVTAPLYLPSNPSIPSKSQFTLFTAVPLPTPSNAAALEPPPVPNTIKTQIHQIQSAGSGGGPIANPSTSPFATHIPLTHPLKPILDSSLDSILKAVSLRTIHSYLTAWRCFKAFHLSYNLPFPDFSLLAITSFISYLNSIKNLQAGSIKGYLSGVQIFSQTNLRLPLLRSK